VIAAAHICTPEDSLASLLRFCREFGAPCWVHWPDESLADWLRFHGNHGSLVEVQDGERTVGVSIVWQGPERELEHRPWVPTDTGGDSLYVAHWVAVDRQANRQMVAEWQRRIPRWASLNLWMRRDRRGLVRIPHRLIRMFTHGTE